MVAYTGFGDEYFNNSETTETTENEKQFLQRYKSVLSSKSSEETMVKINNYVL